MSLEMGSSTKSFKQREQLHEDVTHLDDDIHSLEALVKHSVRSTRHLFVLGMLFVALSLSVTCAVVFTREIHADSSGVLTGSDGKHLAAAIAVSTKDLDLATLTTTPLSKIKDVSIQVTGGVVGFAVTRFTAIDEVVTLFGADGVSISISKSGTVYDSGAAAAGTEEGRRLWGWGGFFTSTDEVEEEEPAIDICSLGSCDHGSRPWYWAAFSTCSCESGWEGICCDSMVGGCSATSVNKCPQSALQEKSFTCADLDYSSGAGLATQPLVLGGSSLPAALQGIFWLQKQADSSSIMSFGQTLDGGDINPGVVASDGKYKVRVGGDRQWSFNDKGASWSLVEAADLIYEFQFNDNTNPTSAQIIAEGVNFGIRASWTWLLDFDMTLYDTEHPTYASSVVWKRNSAVAGQEITSKYYELVQVVNGAGVKLQPPFDEWVAYCGAPEQGDTAGSIWYHSACPGSDSCP